MTWGVAPGWYPDYEAPAGHQRYWDGQRWTEQRSDEATPDVAAGTVTATKEREQLAVAPTPRRPAAPPTEDDGRGPRTAVWLSIAAAVALIAGLVFVIVRDWPGPEESEASAPPPASQPGPPGSGADADQPVSDLAQRTWEVSAVVDGTTIRLTNGAQVRLDGVGENCSIDELAQLVNGRRVTLVRKGIDKDAEGRLVRYVERDGLDIGLRLIQRGVATASTEPHAREASYRRVDERIASTC